MGLSAFADGPISFQEKQMDQVEETSIKRGRPRKEFSTDDMEVGQRPSIIIPPLNETMIREGEKIDVVEPGSANNDYYASLAFMEEPMTIRLERSSEKNAPKLVDVYVNGEACWVPVGQNFKLKRKFVEVLARSKPESIDTRTGSSEEEQPRNEILRNTSSKYPFTVVEDNNPRGYDWLTRVLMEG